MIVKKSDKEFFVILHASPKANYDNISFQWFLDEKEIDGQIFESYPIAVSLSDDKYVNKAIYCILTNKSTGIMNKTEKLTILESVS